jgi:hypothetical protein
MLYGIILGFTNGIFKPDDFLTTPEALTLLVRVLGRGPIVDTVGTWPANYIQDAARLGITKGMVSTNSKLITKENVAIICYSAMQVGTWEIISANDGEINLSITDSLLKKYFAN